MGPDNDDELLKLLCPPKMHFVISGAFGADNGSTIRTENLMLSAERHEKDAENLFEFLTSQLPAGTLERLVAKLQKHAAKVSH